MTVVATLGAVIAAVVPAPAYAGDILVPINNGAVVYSWFDHNGHFNCAILPADPCTSADWMLRSDGQSYQWPTSSLATCEDKVTCYKGHDGIDFWVDRFKTPPHETIYAVSEGDVAISDLYSGYGNRIQISHSQLLYSSQYFHLSARSVNRGDHVRKGQPIGMSGDSGTTTGEHLHFGILDNIGRPVDPYGWTGGGDDPYLPNRAVGYMWATRFGYNTTSSLFVGEHYLSSVPYQEYTGATQSVIAGNRIGVLLNGTVSIKEGPLDSIYWRQVAGGTPASSVASFTLAGRRILIKQNDGQVWAKDGAWDSAWSRQADLDGATTLYATPDRLGALVGNTLKVKGGLADAATTVATSVSNAALSRDRIAITQLDGSVQFKYGDLGAQWSGVIASGVTWVNMGGSRICTLTPSPPSRDYTLRCQEGPPTSFTSTSWITIYPQPTWCVQVNDVRIAVCDQSTLKVAEGPLTMLGAWVSMPAGATEVLLN